MTSDAKLRANKRNATKSTGPKNEAGKGRIRLNALKHSFYAKELIIKEDEKPEYDGLQTMLCQQYVPSTAMQHIAFQRVLCSAWRFKLSVRLEMRRLNALFDLETQKDPLVDGAEEKTEAPRWYGWGRAELRAAVRTLMDLRANIQSHGWIHGEEWREPLTKIFGGEFYGTLSDWSVQDVAAIYLAEHIAEHSKRFDIPHPALQIEGNTDRKVGDPRSRWEMMVKIVDLKLQQLSDFRLLIEGRGAGGDSQSAASVDAGSRYFTTAGRDLERAVAWYEYIKQQGL